MASSVDFIPPASGAHMKGQTCFVKHVKTNMQGGGGNKKNNAKGSTEAFGWKRAQRDP